MCLMFFFFKQKTAYEMRISDWSSDVCSSDLLRSAKPTPLQVPGTGWSSRRIEWMLPEGSRVKKGELIARFSSDESEQDLAQALVDLQRNALARAAKDNELAIAQGRVRSEEHPSELQSLMRISYARFCLKKKNT